MRFSGNDFKPAELLELGFVPVGLAPRAYGQLGYTGAGKNAVVKDGSSAAGLLKQQPQGFRERRRMSEREIDQQLVERAQRGDKHAFELLVSKYQRRLGRLLSRFIRDAGEVEDVTQEAFIKAYRALPNFRGDSAFYTWLYRIGINTAKNYLVSLGRRAPTITEYDSEEAEGFDDGDQLRDVNTPENVLMSKQVAQAVNQSMEKLPEELKTAITLREIEGMSYEDIARIMDCPIGTVRSRIFRAREAIAEQLKPLLDTTGKDKRW
jgi:RNA polymerase sigma factor RpoE